MKVNNDLIRKQIVIYFLCGFSPHTFFFRNVELAGRVQEILLIRKTKKAPIRKLCVH